MIITLDGPTLQVHAHFEAKENPEKRLLTFFEDLGRACPGATIEIARSGPTAKTLDKADVYVIPTRLDPWRPGDISAIAEFVRQGGGLWMLSNHHPYHAPDDALAKVFDIVFEPTFYHRKGRVTEISGDLLFDHPVLGGSDGTEPVATLVTNTTCSLRSPRAAPVAALSPAMADRLTGESPPTGALYALALDEQHHPDLTGKGRVLAVADSGFLGRGDTAYPGPGQIEQGDNRAFIRNAVRWLCG